MAALRVREPILTFPMTPKYFMLNLKLSQTISAKNAAALDKDLMSIGAFSLDQLMELAGLSVSQAGTYNIIDPPPFHTCHTRPPPFKIHVKRHPAVKKTDPLLTWGRGGI